MEIPQEIEAFLSKFGAAVMSALVATIAKISNEILLKRKLSWVAWIAIVGVSLFWAWMGGLFCAWMNYSSFATSLIVGLATLLGEKINIYLAQNYRTIFEKVVNIFIPKK
jgi:polyferredoxin